MRRKLCRCLRQVVQHREALVVAYSDIHVLEWSGPHRASSGCDLGPILYGMQVPQQTFRQCIIRGRHLCRPCLRGTHCHFGCSPPALASLAGASAILWPGVSPPRYLPPLGGIYVHLFTKVSRGCLRGPRAGLRTSRYFLGTSRH